MRRSLPLHLAVLAVLAVFSACSGGGKATNSIATGSTPSTNTFLPDTGGSVGTEPTTAQASSTTAAAPETSVAHEPAPLASEGRANLTGHILIGTSVHADHTLHGVGGQFPSSVAAVVAGMLLGDVPNGMGATITWSKETPDGEQTIFTQHASLRPHAVLYASATGIAPIQLGLYRVHVSAAGDEHDALFVIVPAVLSLARPSALVRIAAPRAATDAPPAPGEVVVDDPPSPCLGSGDDVGRPECGGLWFSGDDDSGAASPDTSPATDPPPCPPPGTAHVFDVQEDWLPGGYVDISASASSRRDDCPADNVALSAAVNGAAPTPVNSGAPGARWEGNTCDLPGASDLYGDTVTAAAVVDGGTPSSSQIQLHEIGPIPAVLQANPPIGSVVQPRSTIDFYVLAVVMGATRGIKSLIVTGPDGTEVAHEGRDAPATACDGSLSRFGIMAHATYKVPSDPPPIVEFLVAAETFDGSKVHVPVRYSTKPTWSGTLKLTVDQDVPSGHQHMQYVADVVVAEVASNSLAGRMRGPWTQVLDIAACPADTVTDGLVDVPLTGTIDSTGMHFTLGQGTSTPPILTPCHGQQGGLMGSPLAFPHLATVLGNVSPQGDGRYTASLSATEPGGGYPYVVNVEIQLHAGADVDPNSPAIDLQIAVPPT